MLTGEGVFVVAGCTVEPDNNRIFRDSASLIIEPKVMDLLVALAHHPDEVLSRDQLIEEVWQGRVVSDEAVNRSIFELRKTFRDLGVEQEVIVTVRKRGYRLAVPLVPPKPESREPVTESESPEGALSEESGSGSSPGSAPRQFRRYTPSPVGATLVVVLLAIAVGVAWLSVTGLSRSERQPAVPLMVEVGPFVAMDSRGDGSGRDQSTAATLLEKQLIGLLELEPTIRVVPAAAGAAATGSAVQGEVKAGGGDERGGRRAEEANPERHFTVAGEIANAASDTFRVTARLLNPRQEELWGETFEFRRKRVGIDEASVRIRDSVMGHLPQADRAAGCPKVDDIQLLNTYYRAASLIGRRGWEPLLEAKALLESTVEQYPDFAQAWSLLVWTYRLLTTHAPDSPEAAGVTSEMMPLVDHAAETALSLCPDQASAFLVVGDSVGYSGSHGLIAYDYKLRQALALEPGNTEVLRHRAEILYRFGRVEEARVPLLRAFSLASNHGRILVDMAQLAMDSADAENAGFLLRSADQEGYAGVRYKWWRYAFLTRDAEALRDEVPDYLEPVSLLVMKALQDPDDDVARQHAVDALLITLEDNPARDVLYLVVYSGLWLKENDLVWAVINLVGDRPAPMDWFWWPESAEFRADPRFAAMQQQRMLEYWQHLGAPSPCNLSDTRLVCPAPNTVERAGGGYSEPPI